MLSKWQLQWLLLFVSRNHNNDSRSIIEGMAVLNYLSVFLIWLFEQLGLISGFGFPTRFPLTPQFSLFSSYLYFVMVPFDRITSSLPSWNFKHGSLKRSPFLKGFYFFKNLNSCCFLSHWSDERAVFPWRLAQRHNNRSWSLNRNLEFVSEDLVAQTALLPQTFRCILGKLT